MVCYGLVLGTDVAGPTLLEPEPPPSPLLGVLWGQDSTSLSSLLTSATTSLGSHRHPSLPRRLFRLTSRLTLHDVRLVFEQQRKTAPLSSGPGGFSQVSSPVFSSPHLPCHGVPLLGSPSDWHPRLTHPLSSGTSTNHSLQPPLLTYYFAQGSADGWSPRAPHSPIPGAFPGPTSFSPPGLWGLVNPLPTLAYTAWPAVSEP